MVFFVLILPYGGVKIDLFTGKIKKISEIGDYFHFPSLDVSLDILHKG